MYIEKVEENVIKVWVRIEIYILMRVRKRIDKIGWSMKKNEYKVWKKTKSEI